MALVIFRLKINDIFDLRGQSHVDTNGDK